MGNVVVYNFGDSQVHILHVFHTAQDWQSKLAEDLK
jgi:plasmid stabilization system protein ParE